jgi:hypothetical protein
MTLAVLLLQTAADVPNWAPLGVGGVLAGVMFYFYRQDRLESEKRMGEIIKDFRGIIEANTAAMTGLQKAIEHEK